MRPFPLPTLFGKKFTAVYGGPYYDRPATHFGVKMAVEISTPCDVNIPTRDYSVPSMPILSDGLTETLLHMVHNPGKPVYVGCMGGIGRTGLFLAVMAKAFGAKEPVAYVREHYLSHAVETAHQQKFVKAFEVTSQQRWLVFRLRLRNFFKSA